jgi:hypothetical protein
LAFPNEDADRSQEIECQGDRMPRYLSLHTLACLTRQGAEQLTSRMVTADKVTVRRVQVNLMEGKMLVECEAVDRETLESWMTAQRFHYDWLMRVELELQQGTLQAAP